MAALNDRFPKVDSLRKLSREELLEELSKKQKELALSRLRHKVASLEKTSDLKHLRRTIARMQTVLQEK